MSTAPRDYLSGACLCISRAAWERVGPFNEELFLYYEDVDWCLRARALGVPLTVALDAQRVAQRRRLERRRAGRDVGLLLDAQPALVARAAAAARRKARREAAAHELARAAARGAVGAPRRRARQACGRARLVRASHGAGPVAGLKVAFDVACLAQTRAGTARLAIGLARRAAGARRRRADRAGPARVAGARLARPEARRAAAGSRAGTACGSAKEARARGGATCCTARRSAGRCARPGMPTVVTVHDLAVLREPSWFPAWSRNYGRTLMPRAVRNADRVICVSRATARDAVGLLDVPYRKLRVIPNAIEPRVLEPARARRRSSRRTCSASARRSRARTCRRCSRRSRSCAGPAGACGWRSSAPTAGATCASARPRASWRSAASTTPSCATSTPTPRRSCCRASGRASACRSPRRWPRAAASPAPNIPALRELAGEDATYFDPSSPEAISEGILRALTQPRPAPRRGTSWDDAAASVVALWRELVP